MSAIASKNFTVYYGHFSISAFSLSKLLFCHPVCHPVYLAGKSLNKVADACHDGDLDLLETFLKFGAFGTF